MAACRIEMRLVANAVGCEGLIEKARIFTGDAAVVLAGPHEGRRVGVTDEVLARESLAHRLIAARETEKAALVRHTLLHSDDRVAEHKRVRAGAGQKLIAERGAGGREMAGGRKAGDTDPVRIDAVPVCIVTHVPDGPEQVHLRVRIAGRGDAVAQNEGRKAALLKEGLDRRPLVLEAHEFVAAARADNDAGPAAA